MRKPAKTAALLFGLGVGAAVGPSLGTAALWPAVAVAALGVGLAMVGESEPDLIADRTVDSDGNSASADTSFEEWRQRHERPTLSGLGTQVERILKLAEEQANDHRADAKRESEDLVAAARQEAETILSRARDQAAGITGADHSRDSEPLA
jgi:gas vesicle protein